MNNKFRLISIVFISALSINSALALPIDWTGVFGVDSHMLSNTCRTSDKIGPNEKPVPGDSGTSVPANTRSGTQALRNGDCDATFQTYTLRLNPNIIINDGVTLKGELSTGYIRGGFAGGDVQNVGDKTSGNNAYFFTTPAQRSALNVNQMYMEMYADTALIKIGRMSRHYGTGIIYDSGSDPWDRFLTMYDGIDAEMRIGNFSVAPFYAKINSYGGTNNTNNGKEAAGVNDVRELGLVAKYDNKNRDFIASILYAQRSSEKRNTLLNVSSATDNTELRGKTSVTILEPYVSKKWNKFKLSAEASLQSGDFGNVYGDGTNSKIAGTAYFAEAKYELNPKWDIGLLGGQISGDKGDTGKFEAVYLHPNFQIADLMFRYNYAAINEGGRSIFDSSITNTRFFKFYGNYRTDKWTWKGALIMAKALETSQGNGKKAYHHEENYQYTSNAKQDDDIGMEIDFGFDYRWNPNVILSGYYGYWQVGDYYSFTNSATKLSLANVHGGGMKVTLEF